MKTGQKAPRSASSGKKMTMSDFTAPDFTNDVDFWLRIWQTISYHWEKAWAERTDDAPPWWVGRTAGRIFRLREISGFADSYFHGSLVAGPCIDPNHKHRSFDEAEMAWRKKSHESLRRRIFGPQPSRKELVEMVKRLRWQVSDLCSDGFSSFPTYEEIEETYVHVDDGGTSEGECCNLHPGDLTSKLI